MSHQCELPKLPDMLTAPERPDFRCSVCGQWWRDFWGSGGGNGEYGKRYWGRVEA